MRGRKCGVRVSWPRVITLSLYSDPIIRDWQDLITILPVPVFVNT